MSRFAYLATTPAPENLAVPTTEQEENICYLTKKMSILSFYSYLHCGARLVCYFLFLLLGLSLSESAYLYMYGMTGHLT
jgi:hypothetical protein